MKQIQPQRQPEYIFSFQSLEASDSELLGCLGIKTKINTAEGRGVGTMTSSVERAKARGWWIPLDENSTHLEKIRAVLVFQLGWELFCKSYMKYSNVDISLVLNHYTLLDDGFPEWCLGADV